jgi:predicted phosphodiesterase
MGDNDIPADEAIAPPTKVAARRIGVIADDHNAAADGSTLPAEVLDAFAGVDLILHLGHMGVREQLGRGVLDRLEGVAPVLAIRDYTANEAGEMFVTPADGDRVAGLTRVVDAEGTRIGAVHNLSQPPGPAITTPPGGLPELAGVDVAKALDEKFGGPVDVVAFGSSHRPAVAFADGVLFVNPGSPTYGKGPGRIPGQTPLGTVGILDLDGKTATFELIELSCLRDAAAKEHAPA